MATKRKKLYFNVSVTNTAVGYQAIFPCTQFKASYAGDLYGGVLDDFQPATIGTPAETRRRMEVAAWFQPVHSSGTGTTEGFVLARFTNATQTLTGASMLAVPAGGGADGSTPIYTRHFAVALRRDGAATFSGRLYVQRQHSIEI